MRFTLFVAISFFYLNINAQSLFTKNYVRSGKENIAGISTVDNGYLLFGTRDTDHFLVLLKIDTAGSVSWNKDYRFPYIQPAFAIQTHDSGFLIAAVGPSYSWIWGFGKPAVILMRIDSNGDTLWINNYGGADNIQISSIIETSENKFIVSYSGSYHSGYSFSAVDAIDSTGNLLWGYSSRGGNIVSSKSGGFTLFGGPKILEANSSGSIIRAHHLKGMEYFSNTWAHTAPDGGIIASYVTQNYAVLLKFDSVLNPLWAIRTRQWIGSLKVMPDGNIFLGGANWFEKLDSNGNHIYSCEISTNQISSIRGSFVASSDGMPSLLGTGEIITSGNDDIYLYKTDSLLSNLCFSQTSFYPDSLFPLPIDSLYNDSLIMSGGVQWQYAPAPLQNRLYAEIDGCIIANQQNIPAINKFSIFPNPANDQIYILPPEGTTSIKLFDVSGRIVWSKNNYSGSDQTIQISSIRSGIYILEIVTKQERFIRKIVFEN